MAKNIRIAVVILRSPGRISPKCKNGPHSSPGVLVQDIPYLLPAMPYASKVGNRRNTGFMLDAQHHLAGKLAGGAPCAIRHADETGAVRLQFTDSLVQGRRCLLVLGGKNSKDRLGPAPDCNLSLRCTSLYLAWLNTDPHHGSMGIITGLGASTGTGAEGEAIPDLSSSVMFSCQLAGGTMTSSPGLMGSLSLLSKSVLRFT